MNEFNIQMSLFEWNYWNKSTSWWYDQRLYERDKTHSSVRKAKYFHVLSL